MRWRGQRRRRRDGDEAEDRQLYADISVTQPKSKQKLKLKTKTRCHKAFNGRLDISICKQTRSKETLSGAGSVRRGKERPEGRGACRRQDTTAVNNMQQTCKYANQRTLTIFSQIKYAIAAGIHSMSSSLSLWLSPFLSLSLSLLLPLGCLTNFVNLYLPRAAHTNNPRNRLGQQCSNSNKQLQKVTVILGKVLLQVPLPYHDPDPGRESCLVYCCCCCCACSLS